MIQIEMLRHHRRAIENSPATTDRQRLDKSAALAAIDRLIELTKNK